ncbi:4-hydroxybenzoyl-CoA thioesterase [Limnohabitans sp. Jir61]|jgi:4-hydroxybenzoyl-CoA thioesterase|uniref:acyl-CoA thioesterase n=1 Tax=Limnohabitans sp. Jir61 TaxID=1826168 RepID=UPI000D376600|nr:acyl-CoA thioesterase [Limnohabitans sp. Jir61]PUE32635.1 4-hydroxybenzoyl-CoA thioesterase [Limnohabitans sp. Jir61]
MNKVVIYKVNVEFGDCDPAKIVWFPNYFKWLDAASRNFFVKCGVPSWKETEKSMGILGTPLVNIQTRFVKTASYGDHLNVHVSVSEWRNTSFVMEYKIYRDTDLILEAQDVRVFAAFCETGNPDQPSIRAVPIPPFILELCQ